MAAYGDWTSSDGALLWSAVGTPVAYWAAVEAAVADEKMGKVGMLSLYNIHGQCADAQGIVEQRSTETVRIDDVVWGQREKGKK